MLGILGILVSLALPITLAYRGWNVILIAPICAAVALAFAAGDEPLFATYTQVYMPALGNYLIKFFPLFLLGAVFGKLMDDSGAARAIAHRIVEWTGREHAILAIVLACAILTYGGVSLFVVAFAVFPIALQMFREGNLPKRLIPGAIALGSFTFTMTALPGTPAIQNAIPMPFFRTDTFAAPGLSVIAALIMFAAGTVWLMMRARRAKAAGEGFGAEAGPATDPKQATTQSAAPSNPWGTRATAQTAGTGNQRGTGARPQTAGTALPPGTGAPDPSGNPTPTGSANAPTTAPASSAATAATESAKTRSAAAEPIGDTPSFAVAILPVILVLVLNFIFSKYLLPALDTSYLASPKYGRTTASAVLGTWALIGAMLIACVVLLAITWNRFRNVRQSLNEGTLGSMLPVLNVSSEVGYGAVIASLAAFALVREWLGTLTDNPVIGLAIIVNVLAGITGSASGGMSIALQALGEQYLKEAQAMNISPEILHRVATLSSGGLDALPHNGAVVTLLAICGLTHRQSYFDIFMVSVAFPVLALVAVIVLQQLFGTF